MHGSIKISVKKYNFMLYIVITNSVESLLNMHNKFREESRCRYVPSNNCYKIIRYCSL